MANTYQLISSTTLGSNQSTVVFSSIPQTYTDLVIRASIRGSGGGTNDQLSIWFNGETSGTNYSYTNLQGNVSSVLSGSASNTSDTRIFWINATAATASTFANVEIYIPSYRASISKPLNAMSMAEDNSTTTRLGTNSLLWRNTAAINSITLACQQYVGNGTTILAGSSFYLYGINNS